MNSLRQECYHHDSLKATIMSVGTCNDSGQPQWQWAMEMMVDYHEDNEANPMGVDNDMTVGTTLVGGTHHVGGQISWKAKAEEITTMCVTKSTNITMEQTIYHFDNISVTVAFNWQQAVFWW